MMKAIVDAPKGTAVGYWQKGSAIPVRRVREDSVTPPCLNRVSTDGTVLREQQTEEDNDGGDGNVSGSEHWDGQRSQPSLSNVPVP